MLFSSLVVTCHSVVCHSVVNAAPPSVHQSAEKDTPGVAGENTAGGYGVSGKSDNGAGVYAFSTNYNGVLGETTANGLAGVAGVSKRDGNGVYGRSDGKGHGVYGISDQGVGVLGESNKYVGVFGRSTNYNGVLGETAANGHAGVAGIGKSDGNGVIGRSDGKGHGVYGISDQGVGVLGESNKEVGVFGRSTDYEGVHGETAATGSSGVVGINKNDGNGVYGQSRGGYGVHGTSKGWDGVYGISERRNGVVGEAKANPHSGVFGWHENDGNGVTGRSEGKGIGVFGFSAGFEGVHGETEMTAYAGVAGINKKDGWGIYGQSFGNGVGVFGTGNGGGMTGVGRVGPGVLGQSVENHGVLGESEANERAGVAGVNKQHGHGVRGRSEGQGNGVYGTSNLGRGVVGDSESHDGILGMGHAAQRSGVVGINDHVAGFGVCATSQHGTGLYAKGVTGAQIETAQGVALRIVSGAESVDSSDRSLMEASVGADQRVFRISRSGRVFAAEFHAARPDVAERVTLTDAAEPGDVVEIDPHAPGSFRLARNANSSAVAGVLCTTPGLALDSAETAPGERVGFLALLGRVTAKVTAENGPIHPGDLLVVSGTPGHTMKAPLNPQPGTIVGKALGELPQDQGVINILVMLR